MPNFIPRTFWLPNSPDFNLVDYCLGSVTGSCISYVSEQTCRTETETVTPMEKVGPIDCCYSHQSVASPSLCLCHGFSADILSKFRDGLMVQRAKLKLNKNCGFFYCQTILFIAEV